MTGRLVCGAGVDRVGTGGGRTPAAAWLPGSLPGRDRPVAAGGGERCGEQAWDSGFRVALLCLG